MASMDNYGLKALISACRYCPLPDCDCTSDLGGSLQTVNRYLDPSHQIDKATLKAIWLDLDQNPGSDSPGISPGQEKQRDDGNFQRLTEEAFKTFRDEERHILLNTPVGPLRHDDSTTDKWWNGAAHLRHYFEFLLVLKGIKPCVLFLKHSPDNTTNFSTVVIDSLVPIMNRLDLWSYGFKISFMSNSWVFYDARSSAMPLISKIFLTHPVDKRLNATGTFTAQDNMFRVPHLEVAHALGYPIHFDGSDSDRWINIRDQTEMDVLVSMGRPEPICCVQGMIFSCPVGCEEEWADVLAYYHRCEKAAGSVGTELSLYTAAHTEMTVWLGLNPGFLNGPYAYAGLGRSGPKLHALVEIVRLLEDGYAAVGELEGRRGSVGSNLT